MKNRQRRKGTLKEKRKNENRNEVNGKEKGKMYAKARKINGKPLWEEIIPTYYGTGNIYLGEKKG